MTNATTAQLTALIDRYKRMQADLDAAALESTNATDRNHYRTMRMTYAFIICDLSECLDTIEVTQ